MKCELEKEDTIENERLISALFLYILCKKEPYSFKKKLDNFVGRRIRWKTE